jgi:transcriptional regulator with XRE-family HTH domain
MTSTPCPAEGLQSPLYELMPLGGGSGQVESLTGYVPRLARRHRLATGRLIIDHIGPFLWADGSAGAEDPSGFFGRDTGGLDGSGPRSLQWIDVLQRRTHVQDLRMLTVASWAAALPRRHLTHRYARYCASCFAADLTFPGREPYERLVWRISDVTICAVHKEPLETQCHWCGRARPPISFWSLPGYCPFCRRWLGHPPNLGSGSAPTRWATHVASQVEEALAKRAGDPDSTYVLAGIASLIDATTDGNRAAFAALVGLRSKGSITSWFSGTQPSLTSLLRIAAGVGADLTSILAGIPVADRHERFLPDRDPPRLRNRTNWAVIGISLGEEAGREVPRPLRAVAAEYGVDPVDVRRRFPEAARHLVSLAREARSRAAKERLATLTATLQSIMVDLEREGLVASRRNIEPRLPQGVTLEEESLKRVWRAGRHRTQPRRRRG